MLAAALALVEILAGFGPGYFLFRGRLELDAFLVWRPWTALALAVVWAGAGAGMGWSARARDAALLWLLVAVATAGPPAMVIALGGDAGRALAQTGAALLLVASWLAVALLFRGAGFGGVGTRALVLVFGLAVNSLSQPWAPVPVYERAFAAPHGFNFTPSDRPAIGLATGLPLMWGEGGPPAVLDGRARAAPMLAYLRSQFAVTPLDQVTPDGLARYDAVVLAQPRPLSPRMLVALDAWVRGGGRLLLLVDPDLRWASELPLGDPRRPPRDSGLQPLLAHWGVALEADGGPSTATRRYRTQTPGRLTVDGGTCRLVSGDVANCPIGQGRAVILADADLLHERLWAGVGRSGAWDGVGAAQRSADTPLFIAGIIDDLLGREAVARQRWAADGISWIAPDPPRVAIIAILVVFPLLVVGFALIAPGVAITHRLIHSLPG